MKEGLMMKNNYRAYVYPIITEDGSVVWGAGFPEFECVVGGGDTPEEAIQEAYDNLDVYLEDKGLKNIPLLSNPYINNYSGKFSLRLSKKLHRDLSIRAEEEGQSLNAYCAEILARHIGDESVATITKKQPIVNQNFCQINLVVPGVNFRRGQ